MQARKQGIPLGAERARKSAPAHRAVLILIASSWLLAAIIFAATGGPQRLHPPTLQLVIATLVALFIVAFASSSALRSSVLQQPLWVLTAFHVWRIVPAIVFIVLQKRGMLPAAFAIPATLGDAIVALTALFFSWLCSSPKSSVRWWFITFHLAGFADLVFVVVNAARLSIHSPAEMGALTRFPLSVVPLFWVPITLMVHLVALAQLADNSRN